MHQPNSRYPSYVKLCVLCPVSYRADVVMQKMEQKSPERVKKMMELKDDPELKDVFQDIASNGPAAMEKYWNDTDLMSKIAKKMSALNVRPDTPPRSGEASSSKVVTMFSSHRNLSPL